MSRKSQCLRDDYRQLKATHPELSQLRMAEESGLGVATIQRIARGELVGESTAKTFRTYAAPYDAPPGWPERFAALRQEYKWFDAQKKEVREHFLNTLEPILEKHQALVDSAPSAEAVCALWLLAWVAHDRSELFADKKEENRQLAISRYERAYWIAKDLAKHNSRTFGLMMLKLNVTSWALYFNAQPVKTRSRDPRVTAATNDRDVVGAARAVGECEPHDWSLLRNGLLAASIRKHAKECEEFYRKLVAADLRFARWDYAPNNGRVSSLEEDPDLWFARTVLESEPE